MFNVLLSEEANVDFAEVLDIYSKISPELGERFLVEFDERLLQLENMPYFQVKYDNVRTRKIKNFPILLHYIIFEDTKAVVIYGVRFAREDPRKSIQFP